MKLKADERGYLNIPNGISFIEKEMFANRGDIVKVQVPPSVSYVGDKAFWGCENLKEVVFSSDSVCKDIGVEAFANCISLERVVLSPSLENIHQRAFQNDCSLICLYFPYSVKNIDRFAFLNCENLKNLIFPNSNIVVQDRAFANCLDIHRISFSGEKMNLFPSYMCPGVILHHIKWKNFHFYTMQTFLGIKEGKIFGKKYVSCFGPDGERGEGDTVREAYDDYVFFHIRDRLKEKFEKNCNTNTLMTPFDYRVLSGSCNYGVKDFCKFYHLKPDDLWPMWKIASKLELLPTKDEHIQEFLDFFHALKEKENSATTTNN